MKRFVFVLSLLLFVGFNLLQAQGVQVSGTVTSADDGAALPGVSVVVRGKREQCCLLVPPSDSSAIC